jgi:hypothetical protein
MSTGQIVEWHFRSPVFNRGVIAGCSPDVRGQFFGFTIGGVADMGLRMMLARTPDVPLQTPNCGDTRPSPRWVAFDLSGQFAVNIFRLF